MDPAEATYETAAIHAIKSAPKLAGDTVSWLKTYPTLVYTIPWVGMQAERSVFIGDFMMSHDEREKVKLLQRIRKLRGQLDAVERALTSNDDCGAQLMLLAAVRGGVNGLMGEVLETHIRFHLTDGSKERIAPELAEDLIDLVRAYLK
jgi:DNA-binding FrmR family transcriptional regulator